jgi:hypothetical protein
MDEFVYNSLSTYYNTLEKTGYLSYDNVYKLLLLVFYKDFVYGDFRGVLNEKDYSMIERALYCLFGTTCLIPYPDYLKMGKLCLGDISELAHRVKNLEDTKVIKAIHSLDDIIEDTMQNDVMIVAEEQ